MKKRKNCHKKHLFCLNGKKILPKGWSPPQEVGVGLHIGAVPSNKFESEKKVTNLWKCTFSCACSYKKKMINFPTSGTIRNNLVQTIYNQLFARRIERTSNLPFGLIWFGDVCLNSQHVCSRQNLPEFQSQGYSRQQFQFQKLCVLLSIHSLLYNAQYTL